ncbi:MAG: N-acetyltransferase [Bacteroidales bacterium]|nr:N-acetyltransferase [Bacteroidales bacterium]
MEIKIKEITTKKELKHFIKFPDKLYSGNKYYVPALHRAELNTLSAKTNPAFEFCEAKYWLAFQDNKIVGRIAGIINHRYNEAQNKKYVRFGWLDFIEDENVLKELLLVVEKWGKMHNAELIHGPLGFSSFDASGILTEGFEEIPTSFSHYNYPYYSKLIEKIGFHKEVDWIEFNVKVPETLPDNFVRLPDLLKKRFKLSSIKPKSKRELMNYSDEIFKLLNKEYKGLYAFTELTPKQIENIKNEFIKFIKPEYVTIIVDSSEKLVAFGIATPSLSKALQKAKGKLFPFGFLYIMNALKNNDTVDTLLIAVKKDFQNKGIHSIIFNEFYKTFTKNGITNIETTRELEDNYNVNLLWKKFEYRQHKRARCYFKNL